MAVNITLGNIDIKDITSIHSNASARTVINKNFEKIKANLDILSVIPIENLNKLVFPETPTIGADYSMVWDGSKYIITISTFKNTGTKWKIPTGEEIIVRAGYQYIVHDRIDIEGVLNLEGELVII
jgi:hypothetical protein